MVKKVETIVTMTDDLDGSKADRTVAFSFDSVSYEIDLSKKNASTLEKVLRPYIAAARKAPARTRRAARAGSRKASGRPPDLTAVREWARGNGYELADRGRIPIAILEAYDAAH